MTGHKKIPVLGWSAGVSVQHDTRRLSTCCGNGYKGKAIVRQSLPGPATTDFTQSGRRGQLKFCCNAATDRPAAARTSISEAEVHHWVATIYIAACAYPLWATGVDQMKFGCGRPAGLQPPAGRHCLKALQALSPHRASVKRYQKHSNAYIYRQATKAFPASCGFSPSNSDRR